MIGSTVHYKVAIVTISDRVAQSLAEDKSGPALNELFKSKPEWHVTSMSVVQDDILDIQKEIIKLSTPEDIDLIVTTGGTGFAPRDVTPEAIEPLLEKKAPGIITAMITKSLEITPMAALSRPVAGILQKSLIITLPGSPKGAVENLHHILSILPHALDLIMDRKDQSESLHQSMIKKHSCTHYVRNSDSCNGIEKGVSYRPRKSLYPLIPYQQALEMVMIHASNLNEPFQGSVNSSLVGRILAEDIFAENPIPLFRTSIVDGYAVIASDGPGDYPLMFSSLAGDTLQEATSLTPGRIVRVTTGAPVPVGADAVVMVEYTDIVDRDGQEERIVRIHRQSNAGENIREPGSDIQKGQLVLPKFHKLSAADVGVLCGLGRTKLSVFRHPVVAILSSGNEVIDPTDSISTNSGGIFDANRPMLKSMLDEHKIPLHDLGIIPDESDKVEEALNQALNQADVVITTGGVSMGEKDYLKNILVKMGATIHFGRVLIKPGKPTTFATIQRPDDNRKKLIFGLPGNPVSALTCFYLFTLPALKSMSGYINPHHPLIHVKMAHSIDLDMDRPEFHRVRVEIEHPNSNETILMAYSTGFQRSSRLLSMKSANALLKLDSGTSLGKKSLVAGDLVEALLIESLNA